MGWFGVALPFINAALAMIVSICWVILSESLGLDLLGGQDKDGKDG